jgi:nucleotide-binding universal stress UspA family protein
MTTDNDILRIVIGVDGSPGSRAAMEWCASFASRVGASVTAISVTDPPQPLVPLPASMMDDVASIQSAERDRLREVLDEQWCEPLRVAGVRFEVAVNTGKPAQVLAEVADGLHADLLVVGRHGQGRLKEALIGSVPRYLAHRAKQPLVIVPE